MPLYMLLISNINKPLYMLITFTYTYYTVDIIRVLHKKPTNYHIRNSQITIYSNKPLKIFEKKF